MYSEKIVKCMACDKPLFQLLLNYTSEVDIKYSSNCPYCNCGSFVLSEKTKYVSSCNGLFISNINEISETEQRITLEKKK